MRRLNVIFRSNIRGSPILTVFRIQRTLGSKLLVVRGVLRLQISVTIIDSSHVTTKPSGTQFSFTADKNAVFKIHKYEFQLF